LAHTQGDLTARPSPSIGRMQERQRAQWCPLLATPVVRNLVVKHFDRGSQRTGLPDQLIAPPGQKLHALTSLTVGPQQVSEPAQVRDTQPASRRHVTTPIHATSLSA